MSNLAAALVTVGDYAPACELAEAAVAELGHFNNAQVAMFARATLAEALAGIGNDARALGVVDAMLADATKAPRRAAQNHYMAIAAEICARHGRIDDAAACAETARAIHADFPAGSTKCTAAGRTPWLRTRAMSRPRFRACRLRRKPRSATATCPVNARRGRDSPNAMPMRAISRQPMPAAGNC